MNYYSKTEMNSWDYILNKYDKKKNIKERNLQSELKLLEKEIQLEFESTIAFEEKLCKFICKFKLLIQSYMNQPFDEKTNTEISKICNEIEESKFEIEKNKKVAESLQRKVRLLKEKIAMNA